MPIQDLYEIYLRHPSVQTDSRRIKKGDLFFALKGEHFNGNTFARKALNAGAVLAVIDDASCEIPGRTMLVEDVLSTLQQLAGLHRSQFDIPVIAITGSNGKTTTKELLHVVLSSSYKTYTTEGNLNNHIGIPLTLLRIRKDAEMAVVEMGANHIGEIAGYCKYTRPTHGIITNCGKAHLEGFGSLEGVRKAKGELYDYLRAQRGTAFIMWDYEYLRKMSKGISGAIKYGTANAHVTGRVVKSDPLLEMEITQGLDQPLVHTQLVGSYNFPNVLAAITVGKFFSVPETRIVQAIETYIPSNSRSQLLQMGSNTIILDAYNANPSSMKLAIENFAAMPAGHKVLMLGGMAELGAESLDEHRAIIDLVQQFQWDDVVLVGGDFLRLDHPFTSFPDAAAAKEWLKHHPLENTHLLVKGSRSMQMEKILEP